MPFRVRVPKVRCRDAIEYRCNVTSVWSCLLLDVSRLQNMQVGLPCSHRPVPFQVCGISSATTTLGLHLDRRFESSSPGWHRDFDLAGWQSNAIRQCILYRANRYWVMILNACGGSAFSPTERDSFGTERTIAA